MFVWESLVEMLVRSPIWRMSKGLALAGSERGCVEQPILLRFTSGLALDCGDNSKIGSRGIPFA